MIRKAQSLHPGIEFTVADMLELPFENQSFASAVAFYSIVHFSKEELLIVFREISRVLIPEGQFLFSFHKGNESIHRDEFLGKKVNIDFMFFEVKEIKSLVDKAGFRVVDVIERDPYPDIEYPSQRVYIWVQKTR
jgi:SAM-dependent methyltransferase